MAYGRGPEVLQDIDLTIKSGSFHFVTGASGVGKSSLLRLLSLAERPRSGSMTVFGYDLGQVRRHDLAGLRQRIGMVFQDLRLMRHLSAFDNVALPLRIAGTPDEKISTTVSDMFTWLELEPVMERMPGELSIGQQQLVAVARAVIVRPTLLLADEPTSNVDGRRAERLMNLFKQMQKLGSAIVLATHSGDLLRKHAFPILHIEKGRVGLPQRPSMMAAD